MEMNRVFDLRLNLGNWLELPLWIKQGKQKGYDNLNAY